MSIAPGPSTASLSCPTDPNWALPRSTKQVFSDHEVLEEINVWMDGQLPCVAGRRAFKRGIYMVRVGQD
jgi:hypothetical protein